MREFPNLSRSVKTKLLPLAKRTQKSVTPWAQSWRVKGENNKLEIGQGREPRCGLKLSAERGMLQVKKVTVVEKQLIN